MTAEPKDDNVEDSRRTSSHQRNDIPNNKRNKNHTFFHTRGAPLPGSPKSDEITKKKKQRQQTQINTKDEKFDWTSRLRPQGKLFYYTDQVTLLQKQLHFVDSRINISPSSCDGFEKKKYKYFPRLLCERMGPY
jgi:hypothetical protein